MFRLLKNNKGFLDPISWAIIGAATIGAGATAYSASQTNKAMEKEAEKNREFQGEKSDTAHQREVADLKAAGLNPILSAKFGGASTPSGSMASLQNPMSDSTDTLLGGVNASINRQLTKSQVATEMTKQDLNSAVALKTRAEVGKVLADTRLAKAQADIYSAKAWSQGSAYGRGLQVFKDIKDLINPLNGIMGGNK